MSESDIFVRDMLHKQLAASEAEVKCLGDKWLEARARALAYERALKKIAIAIELEDAQEIAEAALDKPEEGK